jgi:hypothetical protein
MEEQDSDRQKIEYEIGDIVEEVYYIIPPDRKPWVGIVVEVTKAKGELYGVLGIWEDMISVYWLKRQYTELLPASVLNLIKKAKNNT